MRYRSWLKGKMTSGMSGLPRKIQSFDSCTHIAYYIYFHISVADEKIIWKTIMICLSNLPFVTIILRLLSLLKTIRWRNESQWVIPTCRSSVALYNTWLAFHFVFIRQWYHKYFKTRYVCTYARTDVSMYVCMYVCVHVLLNK